jgi:hypothetical protein
LALLASYAIFIFVVPVIILYLDVDLRANVMGRIKNNFKVLSNAVEDPFQRTIEDLGYNCRP